MGTGWVITTYPSKRSIIVLKRDIFNHEEGKNGRLKLFNLSHNIMVWENQIFLSYSRSDKTEVVVTCCSLKSLMESGPGSSVEQAAAATSSWIANLATGASTRSQPYAPSHSVFLVAVTFIILSYLVS